MSVNPPETDPSTRPAPELDATVPPEPRREPVLGLSASQLVGSAAAAATAAALGSRLGLVGTIVGAALISVVTAVAGAVYTRSLQRTKDAMARTAERLPTVRIPAQRAVEPSTRWWHRVRWRRVAVAALAVFLLAGGIVTGVEQLTGRSLDGSGRTSVDQLVGSGDRPTRSIERAQDDGPGSGSERSKDSSDSGSSGSSSGTGQDSSTSEDDQPGSTPTPTGEPSSTPTDEPTTGTGSGTTEPTTQPSATPTPSTGGKS